MGRFVTTLVLASLVAGLSQADELKLTGSNTKIDFKCSKPMVTHVGGFKALTGTATFDAADLTTLKLNVEIDVNSMFTDTEKVTQHLKTADFFDVKNFPKAKFTSTKVEKDGVDYKISGKLNMHGKTKDLTFPAKLAVKDGNLNLSSKFKINRHDWAISYGKGFVEDDVFLEVGISGKK